MKIFNFTRRTLGTFARCLAVIPAIFPVAAAMALQDAPTKPSLSRVTLDTLLEEMTDRGAVTRYPDPPYRCLQASSYNRASLRRGEPGWFADSDGTGFIRTETINGQTEWVVMEHRGPGCITRMWAPNFVPGRRAPRIRIYLDGSDRPVLDEDWIALLVGKGPVAAPFAALTARAGDLYLPIPFASSCKITMTARPFYYCISYRAYPESVRVESFSLAGLRAAEKHLRDTGRRLLSPKPVEPTQTRSVQVTLRHGKTAILTLPRGPAAVSELVVRLDPPEGPFLRSVVMTAAFDGEETARCPVGDFFCCADSIHPYETWNRSVTKEGVMTCRWLMPYRETGTIRFTNLADAPVSLTVRVATSPYEWTNRSLHFHAGWRPDDYERGNVMRDWNFVDIEGKGVYVGDAWTVLNPTEGWWGEGDEKVYVDDAWKSGFPTLFGTGTEDYYGWAGGRIPTRADEFDEPFLANVRVGGRAHGRTRGFNICTRSRSLDAIPFEKRLRFDMEASPGTGQRRASDILGYSAVTFWYARPGAESNRGAEPVAAARPIMSLDTIAAMAEGARPDWLLDPAPYKARILASPDGKKLVLDNGLIRRTFRLSPNAATVGLESPATGKSILRAVKPEASLTLNGKVYPVGGLIGQPCRNYLTEAMLNVMDADPDAYRFVRWEERPMVKRFDWKRHPEWLSRETPWPPPGKHIVMYYEPPGARRERLAGPVLLEETMAAPLDESWTTHVTPAHPEASFSYRGTPGAIYAPPNTCVYAERAWPKKARSVEVVVTCGDDRVANSWGPGVAIGKGKKIVSLVARPASESFETFGSRGGTLTGRFDRTRPVTLRIRLIGRLARLEALQEGRPLQVLDTQPFPDTPQWIRVGKVGKRGAGKDNRGRHLAPRHSRILRIVFRGEEPQPTPSRSDLPAVAIHYEIYDGLPALSKWIVLCNTTKKTLRLDAFSAERLATVETAPKIQEGWTRETINSGLLPPDQKLLEHPPFLANRPEAPRDYLDRFMDLFVVTDYAMGGEMEPMKDNPAVAWKLDPEYEKTGIRYYGLYQPAMLECAPLIGPRLDIAPGTTWTSFRVFELLRDGTDRQRRALAECRFWSTLAPWTLENPIYMHITFGNPDKIRAAIDQCAEVGFEMVVLSFGSGFNPMSDNPKYLDSIRTLAAYARSRGIAFGGYSLLASRGGAPETLCLALHTGKPARRRVEGSHFGPSPCLATAWGDAYFRKLERFYRETGANVLEHDGSYPGDTCAATNHRGHRDFYDSRWRQWERIRDFYRWCRGQGIYLLVPDWHFLNGSSKIPMGYVETNWSLPRAYQRIIARQNIYDGTFMKGPTMGYMFVPLTQYHGGGAAATVEPLAEHLDHYETQLATLFGAGVQACYRGPRLYDTEATRRVVKRWVDFYKANRTILDSPIVHLRRADGRDWDGWLHVDPFHECRGLAMLYNPLDKDILRTIKLPLYYTGLKDKALLSIRRSFDSNAGDQEKTVALDPQGRAVLQVSIPARKRIAVFVRPAPGKGEKD